VICGKITFTEHALIRMFERRIGRADVREVVERGDIIASYPDDNPYPSFLLLGFPGGHALHVVLAVEREAGHGIVVTVYEPESRLWEEDFRKRRIV
jgi:hypothetical protein